MLMLVAAKDIHAAPSRVVARMMVDESTKSALRVERPPPKDPLAEYPLRGDEAAPPGYRVEHRSRKAPLIDGVFLGGMAYVSGFSIAAANGFENSGGMAGSARRRPLDHARGTQLSSQSRWCVRGRSL
jgi:hypothetical protein